MLLPRDGACCKLERAFKFSVLVQMYEKNLNQPYLLCNVFEVYRKSFSCGPYKTEMYHSHFVWRNAGCKI